MLPTIKHITGRKSFREVVIYFLSSGLARSIPFFLLPLLTRYLSPEDFGMVGLTTIYVALLIPFISASAPNYLFAHYFKLSRSELQNSLNIIITISLFTSVTLIVILTALSYSGLVELILPTWALVAVVLTALFQSTFNVVQTLNQIERRVRQLVTFEASSAILIGFFVIFLVIVLGMKWEGRFLAALLGYGTVGLVGMWILVVSWGTRLMNEPSKARNYLRFSVPLLPHILGLGFLNSVARLYLAKTGELDEAGYYQVAFQILLVLTLFYEALFKVWNPFFYRTIVSADSDDMVKKRMVRLSYAMIGIIIVMGVGFLGVSQFIIRYFVNVQFARSLEYLIWLIPGLVAFNITRIFSSYLYHTKHTITLGAITVIAASINVVLVVWLYGVNGPIGVVQATVASTVIYTMLSIGFAVGYYSMPWLQPFKSTGKGAEPAP